MQWFRFYGNTVFNPKVQMLSAEMFKAWVNLLCIYSIEAKFPSVDHIAFDLRLSESETTDILERLVGARLLDRSEDGSYVPHNWSEFQFETDFSKVRVRKYREKLAKAGEGSNDAAKFRQVVFERDGACCIYCGSEKSLCLDHIYPVALGGRTVLENLATACKSCNSGKSGRTPYQAGLSVRPESIGLVENAVGNLGFGVTVTNSRRGGVSRLHDQHVTVTVTPSKSDTDTYTETDQIANFDFDAEALLSEITKRHPKQEGAALGTRLLAQVIAESPNPEQAAVSINERHRKFCEIECAGRERKFVPSLLNWVRDKKYLDPDPIPEVGAPEPAKKPIPVDPDEFREMALKLRAFNERKMAEEQARIAKEQQEWEAQYGQTG